MTVICFRCLHVYDPVTAPRRATKRLKVKEPACPKCKCKLYFNRTDESPLSVSYVQEMYSGREED